MSRIGDVFYVPSNGKRRFFQFIGRDLTGLNADVIRVFKTWQPFFYPIDIDTILLDEVDFYTHTYVTFGQKGGFWTKYGHSNRIGTEEILFKGSPGYSFYADPEQVANWRIWKMNGEFFIVSKLPIEYKNSDFGAVFPLNLSYKELLPESFHINSISR